MKYVFICITIMLLSYFTYKIITTGRWNETEFVNYHFKLESVEEVEEYFFTKEMVIATIGTVNGPQCGPVYEWKLNIFGELVADTDNFFTDVTLNKINWSETLVQVLRNGKRVKYIINK